MAHNHSHHHHHDASGMSDNRLRLSILLTGGFVLLEGMVGWKANSLALLSDAGHNLTDALALIFSWYALWIARKPADANRTFGYHRVGILTALLNAITLIVISLVILREAWERFAHPEPVASLPMIAVAAVALFLNTVIAFWLRGEAEHSLNMRGAFIHMVGDALASAGVIVAGLIIRATGWVAIDPLVSALIALFIAWSSWGILAETVNVLLEAAPRGLDMDALTRSLVNSPGVADVHDLHVWTIADGIPALSCHLHLSDEASLAPAEIVQYVKTALARDYAIHHSTIETECFGCAATDLYCQITPQSQSCDHHH